ncbi:hypothetical protein VNI00_007692 [Paramarasmius palmivorus]|uniref:F-box domain-containing protein n=1 Tax=Paramarasmius palmivorus TaxID=297713 RepID=A0AAW0D4S2_9AGAR
MIDEMKRLTIHGTTSCHTDNAHAESIFPLQKIPAEILALVLTFAAEFNVFGPPGLSRSDALTLSAVCSLWRRLAFSTPGVWTRISVVVSIPFPMPPTLLALHYHLELSKDAPLELDVDWTRHGGSNVHPLLTLLQDHVSRWSHLTYKVTGSVANGGIPGHDGYFPQIDFAASGLPFLRSLEIDATCLSSMRFKTLIGSTSRKLTALRLRDLHFFLSPITVQSFAPSLIHITHLAIKATSTAVLVALKACPNLISAHFSVPAAVEPCYLRSEYPDVYEDYSSDRDDDDLLEDMETKLRRVTLPTFFLNEDGNSTKDLEHELEQAIPFCLPHLQNLTLEVAEAGGAWGQVPFWSVFRIILAITCPMHSPTCPSLTSLSVLSYASKDEENHDDDFTSDDDRRAGLIPALEYFLDNMPGAPEKLQSLSLRAIPFTQSEFIHLLSLMPNLRELNVSEAEDGEYEDDDKYREKDIFRGGDGTFMQRMNPVACASAASTLLVPKLRHLGLTVNRDWEDHSFEDMIESRFTEGLVGDLLRSVTLRVIEIEFLDLERLKKLQSSGLAISVTSGQWYHQSKEVLRYS